MASTKGTFPKGEESRGNTDAEPTPLSSGDQPTVSEPLSVSVVDIPITEDSFRVEPTELSCHCNCAAKHHTNGPRGPPVPPKDSKTPSSTSKGMVARVKRGFVSRENERRSTKDAYDAPNHLQRIHGQERHINDLEKRLGEREGHISDLEALVEQYRVRLQENEALKQELSSVRQHLRLGDEDEPWVIVQKFGEINKKVDDISVKFRKLLCKANPSRELNTGDFLERLLIHQKYEYSTPIEAGYLIDPDEFIELGCRSMLNGLLITTVLNRRIFNPEWEPATNQLFQTMYESIQAKEAQVNAGRWRISTFKTIPSHLQSYYETEAKQFCDNVLVPYCQTLYDEESCTAARDAVFSDIVALLELAYAWNHRTRSTVLMLDFEPFYYPPGGRFNSSSARLEASEAKLPPPETILFTSQLGLRSYKAMDKGKGECVCQTKALVVGNGYFSG